MKPYSIYLKTILESAINLEAAKFAYDDDEQNYGYTDNDNDALGIVDDGNGSTDEEVPTRAIRQASRKSDSKGTHDTSKASAKDVQQQIRNTGKKSLDGRLKSLALSVVNAWSARGAEKYPEFDEIMGSILERAGNDRMADPESLVSLLETLGIKAKEEGIALGDGLGDDEVEPFTFDMLSEMYFNSINPDDYGKDVAIPDQATLEYKARLIDANIKGRGDDTPVINPDNTAYKMLNLTAQKTDNTVSRKRSSASGGAIKMANTNLANANVTYVTQVPSGRAFYCVPHSVFEVVKNAISKKKALTDEYDINDLAADYMFLGSKAFKDKYKVATAVTLPRKYTNSGVSLSYPCYASIGISGEVKFGKNFRDIMLADMLTNTMAVTDAAGRPIPGNTVAAIRGALGRAVQKGNTWQVNSKDLVDAITGQYCLASRRIGSFPLFEYFTTNTLNVSTTAQDTSSGEEMDADRGTIAARQNEYMQNRSEDLDSGNAVLKAIDNQYWERINSETTQNVIRAFGLESPDVNAEDSVNMQRTTEILIAISREFEKAGARSRITTYDGMHPTVEIAKSEITPANSITASWSSALEAHGGKKNAMTGILAGVDAYSIVNDLLEWEESYSGNYRSDIDSEVNNLAVEYSAEEAKNALTPNINVEHIIIGAYENPEGIDMGEVAQYTVDYVDIASKRLQLPFLVKPAALAKLLSYIVHALDDIDEADAEENSEDTSTFYETCIRKTSSLVNYIVGEQGITGVVGWLQDKLFNGEPNETILYSMGLLFFARKLRADDDTRGNADYLAEDDDDAGYVPIWTAYDKYGNTDFLNLIANVCRDSGRAISTLWKALNEKGSVDPDIIPDIKRAVHTLSDIDGINFTINVNSSEPDNDTVGEEPNNE